MSEEITTTGAGTDTPETQPAAVGNVTATDTETVTPEVQPAAAEDVSAEAVEVPVAEKDHHKTLEERAEEIADRKIQQRIAEMQAAQAAPEFGSADQEQQVINNILNHRIKMTEIVEEIRLYGVDAPESAELKRQYHAINDWISQAEAVVQTNRQKRTACEVTAKEQAELKRVQDEIASYANGAFRLRGISKEAQDAGNRILTEEFTKDPTLPAKFEDILKGRRMYQGFSGAGAAVDWAISLAEDIRNKRAEAARNHREEGKEKTIGTTVGGLGVSDVKSYDDLMKMPSKEINAFAKAHPQRFETLKKQKFK